VLWWNGVEYKMRGCGKKTHLITRVSRYPGTRLIIIFKSSIKLIINVVHYKRISSDALIVNSLFLVMLN
jgi:hypothetical protein